MLEELKQEVYEANMMLPKLGIVTFSSYFGCRNLCDFCKHII